MIFLHESPQALNTAQQRIEQFLKESLHLKINPSKTILQPIDRGVDFVGQVIKPWRRITRKRTLHHTYHQALTTPNEKLRDTANSYFGLLRQSSHNHHHRAQLAKCLMLRGRAVDKHLTKIFC